MATAGRCRKTSPAYGIDREALAELPGRADVPNGESYTMGQLSSFSVAGEIRHGAELQEH